jgi:plastocyanin
MTRRPIAAALALAAGLACSPAAPAAAQAPVVQAVDDANGDGTGNRWLPSDVTIKAGETVTWRFAGTAIAHNVKSDGANWSFRNEPAAGGPDAPFTFTATGTYAFVCQLHPGPMHGTVTVTDEAGTPPPPPPPPPLSAQPFPNDQAAPASFEARDKVAPALTAVRVSRRARGARVRFRLSEPGRVTITVARAGRRVQTRAVSARGGVNAVVLRGLRAGRYGVELRARDLAGNRARPKRARVTVRA